MNDSRNRRARPGIALIELMVVMLLVAILGAIGIASYRVYIQRTYRVDAITNLERAMVNQERFYNQNHTYTTNRVDAGMAPNGVTDRGLYQIDILMADDREWAMIATALSDDSDCQTFSVDSKGVRTSSPKTDCWP